MEGQKSAFREMKAKSGSVRCKAISLDKNGFRLEKIGFRLGFWRFGLEAHLTHGTRVRAIQWKKSGITITIFA